MNENKNLLMLPHHLSDELSGTVPGRIRTPVLLDVLLGNRVEHDGGHHPEQKKVEENVKSFDLKWKVF